MIIYHFPKIHCSNNDVMISNNDLHLGAPQPSFADLCSSDYGVGYRQQLMREYHNSKLSLAHLCSSDYGGSGLIGSN